MARASAVLNRAGVRIMQLDGVTTIGIWSDLDGPEVRKALRVYGSDRLPIRYLEGAAIPMRYKLRRVEGEPVPRNVLLEMERTPQEPWKVRDRMLQEMGWGSTASSWAEWKAAQLNRLFQGAGRHRAARPDHGRDSPAWRKEERGTRSEAEREALLARPGPRCCRFQGPGRGGGAAAANVL